MFSQSQSQRTTTTTKRTSTRKRAASSSNNGGITKPNRKSAMPEKYANALRSIVEEDPTASPSNVVDELRKNFCADGEPNDWPEQKKLKNKIQAIKKSLKSKIK